MSKPLKKITRKELAGMPHSELSSVKTKRRILASLPEAAESKPKPKTSEENLTPMQRMQRGLAEGGGNDGSN